MSLVRVGLFEWPAEGPPVVKQCVLGSEQGRCSLTLSKIPCIASSCSPSSDYPHGFPQEPRNSFPFCLSLSPPPPPPGQLPPIAAPVGSSWSLPPSLPAMASLPFLSSRGTFPAVCLYAHTPPPPEPEMITSATGFPEHSFPVVVAPWGIRQNLDMWDTGESYSYAPCVCFLSCTPAAQCPSVLICCICRGTGAQHLLL